MRKYVLTIVLFIVGLLEVNYTYAQCASCTITFSGNGNPSPNRNILDGDVVCISGNRSNQINLRDADDLTICIASGVTYSNTFSNADGDNLVINNYGQIGTSGNPRDIRLRNNGTFNNFGTYYGDFRSEDGSDLNNSGTIDGNVWIDDSGGVYTNSGTQTGELRLDNGTQLINSGTLNLSGDVSIPSGVIVSNTGTFEVARDLTNEGTFNSSGGTLIVGGDLINDDDNAILNLGNTTVFDDLVNRGLITLSGSLAIGDDLDNDDNDAIIRPLNTNQCNTIFVGGDINNDDGIITGSNLSGSFQAPLIVNKIPDDGDLTGGAIVDTNLNCSCNAVYDSDGTFYVPAGVTSITVEAWGAGGRGGTRTSNGRGGGGGGGAFSSSTFEVTAGEPLAINVGQGSSSNSAGGSSWVARTEDISDAIVLAVGGNSVANNSGTGATGGLASNGIGDITYSGGNGADETGSRGGGGGSSAGSSENGNDATNQNGANAPTGGGDGGDGRNNGNGFDGNAPGGGGGGAERTGGGNTIRTGGNGGDGKVIISYSCPTYPPCSRVIDDGVISGTTILEFTADCTWDAPEGLLEFEVLAIGGGGGGGARIGGGGGGSGIVHARANVESISTSGIPPGTTYNVIVGSGGAGSTSRNDRGENGFESSFDLGGDYEVRAGGGGGGGSDANNFASSNREGANGFPSSYNNSTVGFSLQSGVLFGGSGGGGSIDEEDGGNGSTDGNDGGDGDDVSAGGGGGVDSDGEDGDGNDGGEGGDGRRFSAFDIVENRFFSAGGGGGGEDDGGDGGSNNSGGDGGDDGDPGEDGITPGSGGGGGGDGNNPGGRGSDGRVFIRYPNFRILPVEYLYFNAKYNSFLRSGDLTWATAKEWENDRFEVERSVNNVTSWEKIGVIDGAGYSDGSIDYDYQDLKLPVAGGNIFYRLKQVDFDGEFSFSDTKSIKVEALPGTTQWRVFPNPTTGYPFSIEILDPSAYRDEPVTLRVISPTGQYEFIQVDEMREMGTQVSNYFEQKASGVYTLEITWGAKREYHKVILRR